jgi:hypothetical protein
VKNQGLMNELTAELIEGARLTPWSPSLDVIVIVATEKDPAFGQKLAALVDEARARAPNKPYRIFTKS